MNITLDVEGEREVIAAIEKMEQAILGDVENAIVETIVLIAREAEKEVPVDEGELRDTIEPVLEEAAGYYLQGKVRAGGEGAPYAIYVHEGTGVHAKGGGGRKTPWVYFDERRGQFFVTRGQRPQPFLRDALNKHVPAFKRKLKAISRKYS